MIQPVDFLRSSVAIKLDVMFLPRSLIFFHSFEDALLV
jgi:hypothetical protein